MMRSKVLQFLDLVLRILTPIGTTLVAVAAMFLLEQALILDFHQDSDAMAAIFVMIVVPIAALAGFVVGFLLVARRKKQTKWEVHEKPNKDAWPPSPKQ